MGRVSLAWRLGQSVWAESPAMDSIGVLERQTSH